jgi:uncharacterized membrane protein YfcA
VDWTTTKAAHARGLSPAAQLRHNSGQKGKGMIDQFSAGLPNHLFLAALVITLFAGFVKGAVGFAMPLILVSAFAVFVPQELALAALILPTLLTNVSQALRQGFAPAKATAVTYWRFLTGTVIFIVLSAPFADLIPRTAYLLMLGIPITAFAGLQLMGKSLAIKLHHRNRAEWGLGILAGIYGGVSGIWGPPLIVFLLSSGVEKRENIRAQGVVYFIGAVTLLFSHLGTGLANSQTLAFSAALCIPAMIGLFMGFAVQDRLDQQRFRRWTQGLLVLTGLNMVRQALFST